MSEAAQTAHIASQQEKLDAIFGITGGKTVDEFLESLSLDQQKISSAMDEISSQMAESSQAIEEGEKALAQNPKAQLQMSDLVLSLKEIEDMVSLSKSVLKHVAEGILSTPLIDSEAVQALSKLVESIHISIAEFIQVYRDKQDFISKVQLMQMQHQQKIELEQLKHNNALERMRAKDKKNSIDVDAHMTSSWEQEKVVQAVEKAFDDGSDE